MNTQDAIDMDHPILDRFRAAGYPPEELTDPAFVTPEMIAEDGWRAVVYQSHGVVSFGIGTETFETDWAPAGVAVEFGRGTVQPIDFFEEAGALNAELPEMFQIDAAANPRVTFFFGPDSERRFPEFTEREAVEALGYWGSEGHLPRGTAEAIADAFGASLADQMFSDDPDTPGEELVRAPMVAKTVAAEVFGGSRSSDSGVTGHKKRRRQAFYRNVDDLREEFGLDD